MDSDLIVFNSFMEESKNWANDIGMKESDICDAVNAVRQDKKRGTSDSKYEVQKESIE